MARTLEEIIAAEKPEVVALARERAEVMLLNIILKERDELVEEIDESFLNKI